MKKGSGMTTASLAQAYGIADEICKLRGLGEPPSKFFTPTTITAEEAHKTLCTYRGD